jgi:hypothetical protein
VAEMHPRLTHVEFAFQPDIFNRWFRFRRQHSITNSTNLFGTMVTIKSTILTSLLVIGVLSVMNFLNFSSFSASKDISEDWAKAMPQQEEKCTTCSLPTEWTAQAGQDRYLFERVFFQQSLCCKGTFVEFGARNGIEHSNTYIFEKFMGWKGLLFEVDPREYPDLERNRKQSHVTNGPICPSTMGNVTIILSQLGGLTGFQDSFGTLLCFSIAC